jgi:hypothetical protein
MNTNNLNQLFESQNNWDFDEPNFGHEKRFLDKLKKQQPKKKKIDWLPISIAASLLLGFGILIINYTNNQNEEITFSPQVQETHDYFSSKINNELINLNKQKNPQNKKLISDAMKEIESFENDYQNLKDEIVKNGENKQIDFAMITNMQTRISFINTVLKQVENINKINNIEDEKHI